MFDKKLILKGYYLNKTNRMKEYEAPFHLIDKVSFLNLLYLYVENLTYLKTEINEIKENYKNILYVKYEMKTSEYNGNNLYDELSREYHKKDKELYFSLIELNHYINLEINIHESYCQFLEGNESNIHKKLQIFFTRIDNEGRENKNAFYKYIQFLNEIISGEDENAINDIHTTTSLNLPNLIKWHKENLIYLYSIKSEVHLLPDVVINIRDRIAINTQEELRHELIIHEIPLPIEKTYSFVNLIWKAFLTLIVATPIGIGLDATWFRPNNYFPPTFEIEFIDSTTLKPFDFKSNYKKRKLLITVTDSTYTINCTDSKLPFYYKERINYSPEFEMAIRPGCNNARVKILVLNSILYHKRKNFFKPKNHHEFKLYLSTK